MSKLKTRVLKPFYHRENRTADRAHKITFQAQTVRNQRSHDTQNSPRRSNPTQPTQELNEGGYKPGYLQTYRPANKLGFGQCKKNSSPQARWIEAFWEVSQLIWPMHGEEPATYPLNLLPRSGSSPNVTYPRDCQQNHFGKVPYNSFASLIIFSKVLYIITPRPRPA